MPAHQPDTSPPGSDPDPWTLGQVPTPALVVDRDRFDRNVATMAAAHPGPALRPHVKAFKSTALAGRLAEAGHRSFCAATVAEVEGMARGGLDDDLLLANEVTDHRRLGPLVDAGASITVAVDSAATIESAAAGGVRSVLIDVDVGLPRCGCQVDEAGILADLARARGLEVRGVMGYEGHLMMVMDPDEKRERVGKSMARLLEAHDAVGGDIVSAGGTGTYAVNTWANEIQAGSYCLMDTQYATLDVPFEIALSVVTTVISVNRRGWFVVDAGLKALGMDHGDPTSLLGEVMFCSDEHTTIRPDDRGMPAVGDRVALLPAHVDPTVAKHPTMWVVDGRPGVELADRPVVDQWPIDLRHW